MLPSYWDSNDKCKYLSLDDAKLRVSYKGTGKDDTEAAAVRADRSIPPSCGLFYFEIYLVSKGRDGHIGIGLSSPTNLLSRLPGWDQNSYGYHADDGFLFRGLGGVGGMEYGPTFTTGDTIGCLVNFRRNTVHYTKNGLCLGLAFEGILNQPLHPTVGLRTPGEIVEANFGKQSFIFDFESELQREREAMMNQSLIVPIPSISQSISEMILQYLIHCGYSETASIFSYSLNSNNNMDMDASEISKDFASISERQKIIKYIIDGDILLAMNELQKNHSTCLENRKDILFQLKYYRFIQMIQTESLEDTIMYGRNNFPANDPQVISNQKILEDIFSLLAYPDPTNSPVSYLFSSEFREKLAESVNGAILHYHGHSSVSALERCLSHTQAVNKAMIKENIPAAALMDISWLYKEQPSSMDLS